MPCAALHTNIVCHARASFPRGLVQPPGSFRFATDALLLAAFALRCPLPKREGTVLDLGCGCGVVALACLLGNSRLRGTGVDIQPTLVAAARENAARLGLEHHFTAESMDLASGPDRERLEKGGSSLVVVNMPFRAAASGRLSREPSRRTALFADERTMPAFLAAAKRALAAKGSLALIYPWETRGALLRSLAAFGFTPVEALPVVTGKPEGARCLIRAAHADAGTDEAVAYAPPLVLHATGGGHTEEALAFCPWL